MLLFSLQALSMHCPLGGIPTFCHQNWDRLYLGAPASPEGSGPLDCANLGGGGASAIFVRSILALAPVLPSYCSRLGGGGGVGMPVQGDRMGWDGSGGGGATLPK